MRLSALGDVVHALPVLSALRARFPDARIDWAVEDKAAALLEGRTDLTAAHVLPRRALNAALRGVPSPGRLWRLARSYARTLRARDYDVALDLQGNLKSGLVTRASGARLRFGLAAPDAREGNRLFTQRRARVPPSARHRVERNLALASALVGAPLPYLAPGFPTSATARDAAAAELARAGITPQEAIVVLHPGTSGFGSFKRWPPERFGALALALAADGRRPVVTYGPGEEELARAVVTRAGGRAVAVAPPSLPALVEVIRRAELFVSGDTGPLHLAALVDTPLLGLFGPKDPAIYGPYGLRADGTAGLLPVMTQDDVACRPCTLRACPDPLCMRTLAPERVAERLTGLLAGLQR
ncbi:MAG: glycosyltransferase family 9 protein [Planctomycetota bacterium]|nr:glycosyltransferase family 9 protein [Planctomycetota bacterium]